jgi:plastocyanin
MDKKIFALILITALFLSGCAETPSLEEENIQDEEDIQEETQQTTEQDETIVEDEEIEEIDEVEDEEELQETEDSETAEKILTIEINNAAFSQKYATIETGTTVVWVNKEKYPHQINHISPNYSFRSPRLLQGDSFNHTFNETGEYSYFCLIFETMGTIKVEDNP